MELRAQNHLIAYSTIILPASGLNLTTNSITEAMNPRSESATTHPQMEIEPLMTLNSVHLYLSIEAPLLV